MAANISKGFIQRRRPLTPERASVNVTMAAARMRIQCRTQVLLQALQSNGGCGFGGALLKQPGRQRTKSPPQGHRDKELKIAVLCEPRQFLNE
eukprot:353182-Chlamydomonas_euryale.AAC.23